MPDQAPDVLQSSYEEVPYDSEPILLSHPDVLATAASLRGMTPAPLSHCRVLELGCAAGGNLLPLAQAYPEAKICGIDFTPGQIAIGQKQAATLGLTNLELKAMSILDVTEEFGQFDYILVHGVFSWVPDDVRDKILNICKHNLAPQGVAYVSYNTYPGWARGQVVRQMLRYFTRHENSPAERIASARHLLSFLPGAVAEQGAPYAEGLRQWCKRIERVPDGELLHDHLEVINQPYYLHQFAAMARASGLQLVGEAGRQPHTLHLSAEARQKLAALPDGELDFDQYLDFLENRTFRRSILCHAERKLERPGPAKLTAMSAHSVMQPRSQAPDLRPDAEEHFQGENQSFSTEDVLTKALLVVLFDALPKSLSVAELQPAIERRLQMEAGGLGAEELCAALYECYRVNLITLQREPPHFVTAPSERPTVSPLARLQARHRHPVATLRHRAVTLSDFDRLVAPLCDGTRDRSTIARALTGLVLEGVFDLNEHGEKVTDPARIEILLEAPLEESLRRLGKMTLFLS